MTLHDGIRPGALQPPSPASVSILHELDLGAHTLVMMSDGSIDLLAHDAQPSALTERGLRLDSVETYRLFISLHEQFRQEATSS